MSNVVESNSCVALSLTAYLGSSSSEITIGTVLNLSETGDGVFYSDSDCSSVITSTTVSSSMSTISIYYKNPTAETSAITVDAGSFGVFNNTLETKGITTLADNTVTAGVNGLASNSAFGNVSGIGIDDYDNDGYLDFQITGTRGAVSLRKNNGDGTFSVGPALSVHGTFDRSTRWSDLDNDGDLDIINTQEPAKLYNKNNGDGTFSLVPDDFSMTAGNIGSITYLDYDKDGDVDIFSPASSNNFIYENDGAGAFTSIDDSVSGLVPVTNGETNAVADINNDGYLDILYRGTSLYLWKNNGDKTFTEISGSAGVSFPGTDYNPNLFFDYDNDGDIDLYLAGDGANNKLYRNNGDETFTDVSVAAGVVGAAVNTKGIAVGDYDNDGYLDLFVANLTSQILYRNNGDGTFTDITAAKGLAAATNNSGSAFADYDNDGDLDLFVTTSTEMKLYENTLNSNSYLKVKLQGLGTAGNTSKDATGIKVELWNAAGTTLLASRFVSGGDSMGSHAPKIQHFGLSGAWGGNNGTYTLKVHFNSGIKIVSGVIPKNISETIGVATYSQTILVIEE